MVGDSLPNRKQVSMVATSAGSASKYQAVEPLGWIDPWGQQVNTPCKLEFYYQDGKIWLLESTSYRAPATVQRSFRAVSC